MIDRPGPLVNAASRLAGPTRVGEQLQISRERVRQIENEALQKLRRLDGERLYAYHQEL